MLPAAVFLLLVVVVGLLSWRARDSRVRIRSCCSARPWPPEDLTGAATPGRD
jgi:hypothetical protein